MDLPSALQRLANYRTHNSRESRDAFTSAYVVYSKNAIQSLGDDKWAFYEQFALAAVDVGRIDVARDCLAHLSTQFPGSPRVQCLEGILKEAVEPPESALKFYQDVMAEDPSNGAAWKRLIAVHRRMGKIDKAVSELSEFLDTFYTDVEGWVELAEIYASCHQYPYSLQSLSHVLLLAPQNPFYVLQAAETAYTAGDIPLAIRFFLMAVDMTDDTGDKPAKDAPPTGITIRAWYGVELCARRLRTDVKATSSASDTPVPKELPLVEQLANDMLKVVYASKGALGKEEATRRLR
ncbi:TPR-like protein [Amylostereum chailletii]|nr:TPR-like protein [Amylostereum chailletii]